MNLIRNILASDVSEIPISDLLSLLNEIWSGSGEDAETSYLELSDGDDLESTIVRMLPRCRLDSPRDAISLLLNRLKDDPQFYEIMHAAIEIAFASDASCNETEMRILRNSVIETLSKNHLLWKADLSLPSRLRVHGLPITQPELLEWRLT